MIRSSQTKSRLRAAGCIALAAAAAGPAWAGGMAPDLQAAVEGATLASNTRTRVIVQYARPARDGKAKAKKLGGSLINRLSLINADTLNLPLWKVKSLAADPDV